MPKRNRTPSNAVMKGGSAGTAAGVLIEVVANVSGHPLPPGSGAALAGALTTLFTYFANGGRKGEAH